MAGMQRGPGDKYYNYKISAEAGRRQTTPLLSRSKERTRFFSLRRVEGGGWEGRQTLRACKAIFS